MKNGLKNNGKKLEMMTTMFNRENFDSYLSNIYRKTKKITDKYMTQDTPPLSLQDQNQNYRLLPTQEGSKTLLKGSQRHLKSISAENLEKLLCSTSISSEPQVRLQKLEEIKIILIKHPDLSKLAYCNGIMAHVSSLVDSQDAEEHKLGSQLLFLLGKVPQIRFRGVRVLSIDGGGIRGIVSLRILQKIEEMSSRKLTDLFDLICGVSTGSLVASGIFGAEASPKRMMGLYRDLGGKIFVRNSLIGAGKVVLSSSFYDSSVFNQILQENFGHGNLTEFVKTTKSPKLSLLSTLVNGREMEQFAFRNYNPPFDRISEFRGSANHPIWQAIRASSAIPFLFDELSLDGQTFQDGGLMYNNPTPVALSEAQNLWPNDPLQCVLSIGSGRAFPSSFPLEKSASPGFKDKFSMILKCVADPEPMHGVLRRLMPSSVYFRLNPILSQYVTFDEVSEEKLDQLIEDTDIYLRKNEIKLKRLIDRLTEPPTVFQRARNSIFRSKYS